MRYAIKATPPGGAPNEFVLSDGSIDREGEVVEAKGWKLERLISDPVALFNHDRDVILGKWTDLRISAGRLIGRLIWDESGKSPIVEHVRALVEQGILRTTSVGFKPVKREPMDPKEPWGPQRYTEQELLEASLVSVPANPNALSIQRSIPRDVLDEIFRKPANEDLARAIALNGKPATSPVHKGTKPMTTIADRIKLKETEINAIKDKIATIRHAVETENRDPTAEEGEQIDALNAEHTATDGALKRLLALESDLAKQIRVEPAAPAILTSPLRRKHTPFDLFVKSYTAQYLAHVTREPVAKILAERYPEDREVEAVVRTATAPAMTNVVGWAQELVQTQIQAAFMESLRPVSIYPTLAANGVSLTFQGQVPIRVPYRKYGTGTPPPNGLADAANNRRLSGAFVGEGAPIPVRQGLTASLALNPYKMAVISVYTREMALSSTPAIEGIIRDAIVEDTAWTLDLSILSAEAAITGVRPAGLYVGVTPITPAAAGAGAAITDIKALVAAITAAGGGRNLVWILNPNQANNLSLTTEAGQFVFAEIMQMDLFRNRVVSLNQPAGTVTLIDAADFASADGAPAFDVSDQTTLHMDDGTYPTPANAPTVKPLVGAASPVIGDVAGPQRSMFQTASIAVRMIMPISWGMRRTGMVQYMTGVNW